MADLSMLRGDTKVLTVTLTNSDDSPLDLTDKTLRFTAKERLTDSDDSAVMAKTEGDGIEVNADPTTGIATVTIYPDDTYDLTYTGWQEYRDLVCDFQVVSDYESEVRTPWRAVLRVFMDVTRTTA